jgi:hypothetical protein
MSKLLVVIVSLGVGAGAAYVLDPERGRHRRALVRDKAMAARNRIRDALDGKTRHWFNLARGYVAEARGLFARGRRTAQNASARIEGRA